MNDPYHAVCSAEGGDTCGTVARCVPPSRPDGPDAGDLPNLYVAADGTAMAEFFTTSVSLAGAGDLPALLDADGSAVIIHELPDDHRTQPIGGAGGRIACGIISDMPEMTR